MGTFQGFVGKSRPERTCKPQRFEELEPSLLYEGTLQLYTILAKRKTSADVFDTTLIILFFCSRAIYNFLHRSCLERTSLLDLSEQDRALLCTVLTNIEHKVWPQCQKDIWEYVGRVYNKSYIKKVYPGKNVHSS